MPRRDTPWEVGWVTRLEERRKRLKPGTCLRISSTVWLAEWRISSAVMTVTLAAVSLARCLMRVPVMTKGSRFVGSCGSSAETSQAIRRSAKKSI